MKKHIQTSITINATAEKVWEILTDFENHTDWNPLIASISGEKEVGKRLSTEMTLLERKPMKFKPKLLVFDTNKELRWFGSLPIRGLFDGEHYFKIVEQENSTVIFEHGENFSGLLVGFMPKVLADTKLGFEQMNEALKARSEKLV